MKKGFLLVCLCLCLLLLAGCNGSYYYVSDHSSVGDTSSKEVSDPVPPCVFGEKGFYDTANDAEYYLAEGIFAVEIGDVVFEGDGVTIHRIGGTQPEYATYLLCDGEGRVYKNCDLPWTVAPGEEGFAEAYPALEIRNENN